MGIYFIVLFTIVFVSLITGIILNIYDNIRIKKHINNKDNSLSKTIRINRLEGLDSLLENNNSQPIIEKQEESKTLFNNYKKEEIEVL